MLASDFISMEIGPKLSDIVQKLKLPDFESHDDITGECLDQNVVYFRNDMSTVSMKHGLRHGHLTGHRHGHFDTASVKN